MSLIDFCTVHENERPRDSLARSVELAQRAESLGFHRMWYAEHHNMPSITSSAPAVLISHVGAHTSSIRLGAGGVMLPNHSPYVIAEQFGMLEELYPGRIDLGLGRAPGTDMHTLGRALRRDAHAAENFPHDVAELSGYLSEESPLPGVQAVPGHGTHVPLYILGSSMFGASLAAKLGLPYAFASHFAPTHLRAATAYYRENFRPSARLSEPYVIAAVNVTASDTHEDAQRQHREMLRERVRTLAARGNRDISDANLDQLVASPSGQQIAEMLHYSAVGTGAEVRDYLADFSQLAQADELMISVLAPTGAENLRAMDILAQAWGLARREAGDLT
nr:MULTISPECIES: LLM class flavin-dependent oxidoreductase [unclassified Corynebacterium]